MYKLSRKQQSHHVPSEGNWGVFFHTTAHKSKAQTFLSSYWVGTTKYDVTDADIRTALKFAVGALNYLELKGIPPLIGSARIHS